MKLAPALLALALIASPGLASAKPHRPPAHHAGTVIRDPQAFVAGVYAHLQRGGPYQPPEDIYSPRLVLLQAAMVRDARGEVPRVDFLFWINGQDGDITDAAISSVAVDQRPLGDRRIVIARFRNSGKPQELHFYFERTATGWKLDDVESVKGENWTLSVLYKYGSWQAY